MISLASSQAETRSLEQGLKILRQARSLVKTLPTGNQQKLFAGIIDGQHGFMLSRAGKNYLAIERHDRGVALLEQTQSEIPEERSILPRALLNRALAFIRIGRQKPAIKDLEQCLALASDHGLALITAKAQHNLGALSLRVGAIPESIHYYEQTNLGYNRVAPDMLPTLRMDQAEALLTAGLAEEAAKYLDEALPVLERDRVRQNLAEAEILRATAALLLDDPDTARRLSTSAQRRLTRRGNLSWAGIAALTRLRTDVSVALRDGRVTAGLRNRALRLADRLTDLRLTDESGVAKALAVRIALRLGHLDQAAAELAGIGRPRRITPIDHRMLLRLCRAELALTQGDRRRALAQAKSGLAELGRIRDRMGGLDLVSGTAVHGRELGELAVRLVLAPDDGRVDVRRLFHWLERTRAQVYRYQPQPPIEDPVLAERVDDYRVLSRELQQARLDGRNPGELAARHATLQREITRLGWQTSLWGEPTPIASLAEVAARLRERAMVSFAVSDGTAVAVVIVDGRPRLVRLGPVAEITAAARELHADLNALAPDRQPTPLVDVIAGSARRRAERLDEKLLRPLAGLVGDRELVIVPTGALYAVAWGTLPSMHGRPLTVAPSATAWLSADQTAGSPTSAHDDGDGPTAEQTGGLRDTSPRDQDSGYHSRFPARAVRGADVSSAGGRGADDRSENGTEPSGPASTAGTPVPRSAEASEAGHVVLISGPDLLGAVGEVAGLRTHHPDARVLEGRQATVGAVLDALDGARLAHVAAHGAHEPENAMFSRLELTDGSLFAHETARLRRAPERVVLAACELALNRIRPGDEALGFAGALLASGSRTVIAATSKVGDQAAADTMAEFHGLLVQGRPPAAALAEAVAREPLRRPFVCLGSGT
ncbi:tetratricopeptide (TPR) repeat protein [Actinoalloteichus hoggarensis]|uniref:CHAT domain-containing protein n=1 Tax=Actinoalloteichus hoggarensis TaxID=1470176 RepID=UPI0012FE115C|nr:CHAT domain-containing protein [Actinoalloteichus hoggarensis]MBB5923985.1 tetratricopeptide (TPR) repeat protein [Actinoalloteichus hoggarensis]